MTRDAVALGALEKTQARLIDELPRQLLTRHRAFLLSLVQGTPAWHLMPFEKLQELPAIKWKLMNLEKLKKADANRFAGQFDVLSKRLARLDSSR